MRKTLNILRMSVASIIAFDPGKPGWKKKDDGSLDLDASGNPVYVDASGREQSVQGDTISRLNNEAKTHRERAEAAEAAAKRYEGIADPEAARKALDTVSKLDQKKLLDAGEVDKVKAEISQQFGTQLEAEKKRSETLQQELDNKTRALEFKSSRFIAERVAVPAEMFEKTFGGQFKVEGGKLVPYDGSGNKIMSPKRMGEPADVDEAFEIIVSSYPFKDQILKAPEHGGSGNNGNGGGRGGQRTMLRGEWAKLPPNKQAEAAQLMQKGELTIVD